MNFMSGRPGFYEDVTVTGGGSPFNVYGSAASGAAPVSSPTANGSGGEEDSDDHMLGGGRGSGEGSSSASGASYALIEKEHMFDKVVTPSDVGKLNRLVIPKQHAEKYFPLDSSANEKGLLLNFEDRNGKPWRFRYSYWNSSQSYVMTKGWSRFVKDKKLDAGDVVSFQRGLGELGKDRLYIDWRRRPDVAELRPPQSIPALSLLPHQFPFHRSLHPWNQPLFLHPPNSPHYRHNQFQNHYPTPTSYGGGAPHYPYNAAYLQGNPYPPSGSIVYSRSGFPIPQEATAGGIRQAEEVVFESVPVVQGKASAKRLRLFGVNMDCPVGGESDELYDDPSMPLIQHMDSSPSINSSVDPPDCLQLMPYNESDDKGKGSVSLDLDM